jgi:hypothetical protein
MLTWFDPFELLSSSLTNTAARAGIVVVKAVLVTPSTSSATAAL